MLDADFAFRFGNLVALAGWVALLVSLFVARMQRPIWSATRFAIPGLLAVGYLVLIVGGVGDTEGGGFGSIAQVRALFASDAALAAGWLHYLAFDLFVGTWIAEDRSGRVPALLVVPCLALTFLFGPVGLLLYLLFRFAFPPVRQEDTA